MFFFKSPSINSEDKKMARVFFYFCLQRSNSLWFESWAGSYFAGLSVAFFLSPSFRVSVSLSIPVIYFRRPSPSGKPFSHPRYPDPHNHWRLIRSGGQAVACREWKRGLKPGLSAIVFFCKYPTPARNLSPRYHRFSNFTNVPKARPFEE